MEERIVSATSSFPSVVALSKMGVNYVPKNYVLPPSQRPKISDGDQHPPTTLPIIDLSSLERPHLRSRTMAEVGMACKELGFFQVINHGIPLSVTKDALAVASEFFNLPNEEKMSLMSLDFRKPVRYGTSLNFINDKVQYWRDFIKHYSHPLSRWIGLWPSNPPTYKKQMGEYAKAVHLLQKQLMEVIFESLGLSHDYLHNDIEEGCQTMTVNCYPTCPEPDLALGLPPHSDYGTLTILLQDLQGLEIMDHDREWHAVPVIEGALIVQLGDQIEIMSNGGYKSVIHRAILNSLARRISIASLHSLALEKKIGPAPELVEQEQDLTYKEGSFSDFLNFLSGNDISEGRYIDTLKKNP